MEKFKRLAAMMREAALNPDKHPEVRPDKKQNKSGSREDWLKKHEDRQDEDSRHF